MFPLDQKSCRPDSMRIEVADNGFMQKVQLCLSFIKDKDYRGGAEERGANEINVFSLCESPRPPRLTEESSITVGQVRLCVLSLG
jgi:hypothetical protein